MLYGFGDVAVLMVYDFKVLSGSVLNHGYYVALEDPTMRACRGMSITDR